MTDLEKEKRIDEILDRGIIREILPSREEFKKSLMTKTLTFYIGADPTGNSLHLSHAKNFMLLEEFRQLGHKVNVLFGDFTACIGDPSDRSSARTKLTREQAKKNASSWISQISAIINFNAKENPARVRYNSEWIDKLTPIDIVNLFAHTTVQQLIERDMFQVRLKNNKPIFLNEFVYPMFQGYDSVAMDVDVELCGTDQIFNALMGRSLVKEINHKEKFVVAVNLMENPKTGELMSKSQGTGVFLNGTAENIFGQVMQQPDEMIEVILINNTRISLEKIKELDIPNKPRDAKLFTAFQITKIFFGEEAAFGAQKVFIDTFSEKVFPKDAEVVHVNSEVISVIDMVCKCLPNESKSEVRRLIIQNAIKIDGEKLSQDITNIEIADNKELKVQIGKRRFFRVLK